MRNLLKYCVIFIGMAVVTYYLWRNEFNKILRSFNCNLIKPSILFSYLKMKTDANLVPIKKYSKHTNTKCGYLSVTQSGRLGNLMGEIATLIGLSIATNRKAVLPESSKNLFRYFPNLIHYVTLNNSLVVNGSWKEIEQKTGLCCHYDPTVVERIKNCKTNYFLKGYYLAWQYFDNYSKEIKRAFAINSSFVSKANYRIDKALEAVNLTRSNAFVIGIHNRRGDFVDSENIAYGRMQNESDHYFRAAITFFRRKHYYQDKSVIFLIVSDDYEYNVKMFGNTIDVFVLKPEDHPISDPISDICLLITCDELILTGGSSYSWWAGYLNGGPVVISALIAKKNSVMSEVINRDHYLPVWLQL